MTLRVILFTGLGLAAVGVIYFLARKPAKFMDLGAVSETWLARYTAAVTEVLGYRVEPTTC
jgi:hypothetical protein